MCPSGEHILVVTDDTSGISKGGGSGPGQLNATIHALPSLDLIRIPQDPYHNVGQAHGKRPTNLEKYTTQHISFTGLSFSVLPPTKPPGSLKNIYKQIATDVPTFAAPTSGCVMKCLPRITAKINIYRDLTPLAKEGVLWLNTCLTVRAHQANSHARKGWETFTAEVVRAVTSRKDGRGVVFFAWGLPAQKTCDSIKIDEVCIMSSRFAAIKITDRGFCSPGQASCTEVGSPII